MKIYAYKTVGDNGDDHPDYITEYCRASKLKDLTGWKTMTENHFFTELAKNTQREKDFTALKIKLNAHRMSVVKNHQSNQVALQAVNNRILFHFGEWLKTFANPKENADCEFNRYKAYLRHSGKRIV